MKMPIPYNPGGIIYPREILSHVPKESCIRMFRISLFGLRELQINMMTKINLRSRIVGDKKQIAEG